MRIRRIFAAAVATLALTGAVLTTAAPALAAPGDIGSTPSFVTGSGSDVAWRVMNKLDTLYNEAPGCNLLAAVGTTQPLDESCQAPFSGVAAGTVNPNHDVIREYAPIGGTAGVSQLCTSGTAGVASVDFARQTKAPSSSTCKGTSFVAYARDALTWESFPGVTGSASAGVTNLTQQQLKDIFVNCTITNWSQIGGTNAPIKIYVPLPQFGTRSAWDTFLGGDTSACIPTADKATHITPAETDNSFVKNTDKPTAIMAVSYGSWVSRYKKTPGGSAIGAVDGVAPNPTTLTDLSFPYGRYVYNAYRNGTFSGPAGPSSDATVRYVGENGFICTASTQKVPYTKTTYRTAINTAITNSGFVPLPLGPTGGGSLSSSYCRLTVNN